MRNVLLLFLLLVMPSKMLADGKMFSHATAFAEPTMPNQRAMICWSNGVERLVIDTKFVGGGTNFAWVVPLPSSPVIEEATTGVFPTLAFQFRPKVIHDPEVAYGVFIFLTSIAYLLIFVRNGGEPRISDVVACAVAGLCFIQISLGCSLIIFLILLVVVHRIRRGLETSWIILAAVLFAALFAGMFFPALGRASRGVSLNDGITELAQKRVGVFDTVVLSAKTPDALLGWLRENQFETPTNTTPIITDYVKNGWVFVATKLHRDDPAITTNSIHPLSFTFPANQPVYPMRLTAIGSVGLNVELYIFGPSRANADYFRTERCAAAWLPENNQPFPPMEKIPIMHPLLRTWTQNNEVATKLTAKLTQEQMQRDVVIHWDEFKPIQQTLYSSNGAFKTAADWSTGSLLVCFLIGSIVTKIKRSEHRSVLKMIALMAGINLVVFGFIYLTLPKIPVHASKFPTSYSRMNLKSLGVGVLMEWEKSPPHSLNEARKAADAFLKNTTENLLLGGKIHEEDSPGNYIIRTTTNGFEYIWYDTDGSENTMK